MQHTTFDVAVLGGGIAGYYAALKAAKQNRSVALIEQRGFVGQELTATGHSWILNGSTPHEVFEAVGARKKLMLRALMDAGVKVLLLSSPVGIATKGNRACGVLLGNKFGLHYLLADQIVDTTAHAVGFAQLGKVKTQAQKDVLVSYTFSIENIRTQYEQSLPVPQSFQLAGDQVYMHSSILPNTMSIEMRYRVPGPISAIEKGSLERQARLKALDVFCWLRNNMPRYKSAHLLDLAGEMLTSQIAETEPVHGMIHFPFHWNQEISTADLDACQEDAAKRLAALHLSHPEQQAPDCFMIHGKCISSWKEQAAAGLPDGLYNVRLQADEGQIPLIVGSAVVAGAGSAGTFAALALLEKGTETIVINPQYDMGGNRTLGRVSNNYHGFVEGMSGRINEETVSLSESIGGSGKVSDRIARILLYHKRLQDPLCTCLSGHTVCGAFMEGAKVKALLVANNDGLYAVNGEVFIDTTSDADAAVFAGAGYDIGCPIDGSVMTIGQWGDSAWRMEKWTDAPYHTDYDILHPDRYDELLRGIALAHGRNSDIDFAPFPNLRESRRIHGEYTLTLTDVLLNKPYDDIISVACTPYDTHGVASSVLLRMGMLEFNENPIYVRIPCRCFIPKGIKNMLVGGKAPSATRDASSLFRMNADVENAGYALGLIAARSLQLGVDVSEVPLAPVQEELKRIGNLPGWAFDKPIDEKTALQHLLLGEPAGLLHTILQPKDVMMPLVYKQYHTVSDDSIRESHAMALAFWGHPEGVDAMIASLLMAQDITDPSILLSDEGFGHKYIRWDGELGAYFRINRLITLLGVAGDKRALPAIMPYVEKAEAGGPLVKGEDTYHKTRLDKWCVPYFDRLLCLVFAMERLADPSAVKPLTALMGKPYISGYFKGAEDHKESCSTSAWLELGIARALARCGGEAGYRKLLLYKQDVRAVFSSHAHKVLKELSEGNEMSESTHLVKPESRLIID